MKAETFEFEHMPVNYYHAGQGRPLLMLHGSGPGASSLGNWGSVMSRLSEDFEIFAMDLIGFGKSGRKLAPPYFDYPMWLRQAQAMLARMPGRQVGIIGHSLSGSLALTLAAREPRIAAVLTTGTMGGQFEVNALTRQVWTGPRERGQLLQTLTGIIHDTSVIDEAYLAAREPVVFAPGYADYFDAMFAGDKQQYADAARLDVTTLAAVQCPVRLLHGREDRAFPPACSHQIAQALPQADLMLLGACSHSVAFERSATFLSLAREFMASHLN